MIEIIGLLVGGSIIYSIFQGIRRGDASPEERLKNPTLLEKANIVSDQFAEHARRYRLGTEFAAEHFQWFDMFKRRVSSALEDAEFYASLEEELSADPRLRMYYEASLKKYRESNLAVRRASGDTTDPQGPMDEADWVKSGPPSEPQPVSDPELTQMFKVSFENRVKQHREFVNEIQERLRWRPQLRKSFEVSMNKYGLSVLLKEYFLKFESTSYSPSTSSPWLQKAFKEQRRLENLASTDAPSAEAVPPAQTADITLPTTSLTSALANKTKGSQTRAIKKAGKEVSPGDLRHEIRALVEKRGIPHLVHFTHCDNLQSILRHGLISVAGCEAQGIRGVRNDKIRLDGQPEAISTSIAFPNYRMFYKYRQMNALADWAIFILSPSVLWEKKCGFSRNNAADARMRCLPRAKLATAQAFEGMFDSPDLSREAWLRSYDPSDSQAEVLVYETIEPRYIEAVAFETVSIERKWAHILGGIESISAGSGKGLFSTRSKVRADATPAGRDVDSLVQTPTSKA